VLKYGKFMLVIVALFIAGAVLANARPKSSGGIGLSVTANGAASADPQKTTGPPAAAPNSNSDLIAEQYTKRLLALMDADKNGKVSKAEFMAFMAAEFDRLDVNHDGELDVKELEKSQLVPVRHGGGHR